MTIAKVKQHFLMDGFRNCPDDSEINFYCKYLCTKKGLEEEKTHELVQLCCVILDSIC